MEKTKLPSVETLFKRAITVEKLLHQLHHGTVMRAAHSARYSDCRDEQHLMALLQQHPVRQQPPPRPTGARTTANGYTVFLATDATEVLDPWPSTWTPVTSQSVARKLRF